MYKFVGSALAVLVVFTIAAAEEFTGIITKYEDGKITFKKFAKKGDKGEEATRPVAAGCKFLKAKFNKDDKKFEADGDLEGGKEAFAKQVKDAAAKKPDDDKKKGFGGGVFAQIITDGDGDKAKVTEIRVFMFKKKDAN
jgi:hypothetical protein